ncbi:MAG: glycosyltransferase [Methylobacter sp.]|nr:glycosyltransferase [Methylobacter sp.]
MTKNHELPEVSIVIPVYNEEAVLPLLFERLYPVLEALKRSYEVIFIDDGSRDHSAALLRRQFQVFPNTTRVIFLRTNVGQHSALIAGFERARGSSIITLDSDLQNPPEEIPALLNQMYKGHDYVGTIRRKRNDSWWRHWASKAMNWLREKITHIHITDQGCMMRGYDRDIIDAVLATTETNTFIPALAYLYAGNPTEIVIDHEERAAGESKYSLIKLIHLNFDLMTGFSTAPLQLFSLIGMAISLLSLIFVMYMGLRRLMLGPEAEGVFTLFAILFFLLGILLFGVGLLGEYVGRIYSQTRSRPRYLIQAVLDNNEEKPASNKNS